ncbi:MAG: hypothetical protein RR482_00445 [Clostridia bacterium]
MEALQALYEKEKTLLFHTLEASKGVKETVEEICALLDRLQHQYGSQQTDAVLRLQMCLLTANAKASVRMMQASSQVEIWAQQTQTVTPKEKWERIFSYLPACVCLLLALWQGISGDWIPAVMAGIAAWMSWFSGMQVAQTTPSMQGVVKVDLRMLASFLDQLVEEMTRALREMEERNVRQPELEQPPLLTKEILESMQTLLEAQYTQDADYAFHAIPALASALQRAGMTLLPYCAEHADWFLLYPSAQPGCTIRPAIVQGDRLLCYGQATGDENGGKVV